MKIHSLGDEEAELSLLCNEMFNIFESCGSIKDLSSSQDKTILNKISDITRNSNKEFFYVKTLHAHITCINNIGYENSLTLYKKYIIDDDSANNTDFYKIVDDNNNTIEVLKTRFENIPFTNEPFTNKHFKKGNLNV